MSVAYKVGETLRVAKVRLDESKTKSPKLFTEGELIKAMTNIDRYVQDKDSKAILKKTEGIGTERTRNTIIDNLIERGLVEKDKKGKLSSSQKARELIALLPAQVSDPVLTAQWETALGLIEQGRVTVEQFMSKQIPFVEQIVTQAKESKFSGAGQSGGGGAPREREAIEALPNDGNECPKCHKGKLHTKKVTRQESKAFGKRFLSCDNNKKVGNTYQGCDYVEWEAKK